MELSVEQRQIATQRPNGHYLLKGVAGSGKTLVGLYRALFLSKNYCFDKDDMVLVAAYNRTLVQYMEHLYTRLQDHNQKDCYSLFTCRNRSVCIQTIDSLMVPYFKDYVKAQRRSYTIGVPRNVSHDIITVGITKIKADYPDVSFLKEKYWVFLLQEIQWIKSSLLTKESDYLNADRLGMGKVNEQAYFQRLPKNSSARKAVFELMQHYTDEIRQRNFCTFADMRIMALWQVRRECKQRYSHLIIDESQDLTHSQLLFLKEIYNCRKPHASILFIMDSAQNIYPQSWLGSGRNIAGIGFNMAGRGYNLHQNRRSTDRIYQAACGLIEECPQIVTKTTSSFPISNRIQGCLPVCRSFSNLNEQADFIAAEIKKTKNIQSLGNVAVLARFKDQLEQLRRRLLEKRIPCGIFMDAAHLFQTEQVNLVT
ncbi:MAG: UvrD-helicase domain-containing protein, partial [Desulfobacteraceae bacterium]